MSRWIRKGDRVFVMRGRDQKKQGIVLRRSREYLWVEGVHLRKKCVKKSQEQPNGGMREIETRIHQSNVRLCIEGKPVKLRVACNSSGERELYYLDSGESKFYRLVKKAAQ